MPLFHVPDEPSPLQLVQSAPDPVRLSGPDGVFQALHPDRADRADGLGLALADQALFLCLMMIGGEEQA